MNFGTRAWRWAVRGSALAIVVAAASAGTQAAATAAQTARASTAVAHSGPVTDPYAPAYHHPYRRGAVPTVGAAARMAAWARQDPPAATAATAAPAVKASNVNDVSYGGATASQNGVMTGPEHVYLVFYGSQWGKMTTTGGTVTFSNDPSGEAAYVQALFKGLGTNGDPWSRVMTQYCQTSSTVTVPFKSRTCPSGAPLVPNPTGGTLAGVWYDNVSSPAKATGHNLGVQAVAAATHFGNTTPALNRDASYIILSAHGTDPDQYVQQNFCAWHDYTGDSLLSGGAVTQHASYGQLAFTNMPYVTDVGVNCGEHFVRTDAAGRLDGVSIVVGHEYAETITDQEPPFGWVNQNPKSVDDGDEVADECAWRTPGTSGGAFKLSLATGTFAMQTIWSNTAGGCAG
jgi:serine protease